MVIFRQLSEPLYHFVLSSAELKAISKRRLQWNLRTKISKEVINPFMTEAVITKKPVHFYMITASVMKELRQLLAMVLIAFSQIV